MDKQQTYSKSLEDSFIDMKLMREGKIPKRTLEDLWNNINKWDNEDAIVKQ